MRATTLAWLLVICGMVGGSAGAAYAADPTTFSVATRFPETSFDPALHYSEFDTMDVVNTYDPLVLPVAGGLPKPHLATGWEVSPDSRMWTLTLRTDVRFHDGSLFTADDVVYSMDRMLTIGKGHSYLWLGLLEPGLTVALDQHTVRFTLNRSYGPFIETLVQLFVVNSKLLQANTTAEGQYGANGDYGTAYLESHDVGSGSYIMGEVVPTKGRFYTKFADYWQGWDDNQFEYVVIRIVPETSWARYMLLSGDVDFVDQWQPLQFYKAITRDGSVGVPASPAAEVYLVQMNTTRPPLDDVNFRKAISHAFDYATATDAIFGGAERAHGPVPSTIPGYDPSTPAYAYDVELAKSLLAMSRYQPGDYELDYAYLDSGVHEPIGLLLQKNLAQLGIKINLQPQQWATMAGNAARAETSPHFFPAYNSAQAPTPDQFTFRMYHPASHGSWQAASHYSNDEVTKLIEQARATSNAQQRNALYADAVKLIVDDAAALWIAYPMHRVALSKRINNYQHVGLTGFDLRVYDMSHR